MLKYRWILGLLVASQAALIASCSKEHAPVSSAAANNLPQPFQTAAPAESLASADRRVSDEAVATITQNRDPFQAFEPGPVSPPRDDRPRKARRFTVDQLKLVAIVQRVETPRAMVVDPRGKGWVITQGELLGRQEKVRVGNRERLASYRVDRIRERDVVLVQDDEGTAAGNGATRVLALPADPIEIEDEDDVVPP
jgi:hypothetical protein